MKKDQFKYAIFILLLGGLITKILGFMIKILFTRAIGEEGISLYTLAIPTYSLLITIATFALPISISKLISEGKKEKTVLITSTLFILIFETLFLLLLQFCIPFIARILLKEKEVEPILVAMSYTLPFISLSSILKGYFLGKLKVTPNIVSNMIEQTIRILFLLLILPICIKRNLMFGIVLFILLSIVTECVSIFVFYLYLPKHSIIQKKDIHINYPVLKSLLNISIPTLASRFIGNIGFFLEPIILTQVLLYLGYSSTFIRSEYAYYNAYAIGLLTIPSFFIGAIDQILLPEVSKYHHSHNIKMVKRRVRQALIYSFLIGFMSSILLLLFKNSLLNILYKTNKGSNYINVLAPFFVLFYIESPLTSTLQAIDKAKESMTITFFGALLKLFILFTTCFLHIGLYSLVISEIINILFVVLVSLKVIYQYMHKERRYQT